MPIKDPVKRAAYNKEWSDNNKEKRNSTYLKYRENNRQANRDRTIYYKYGITGEEYRQLFIDSPICELCDERPSAHLDHDHNTGKVRGVLCLVCNTGLGKLGDTIEGLERALNYLKERTYVN